jgi:GT2 family glycosyltransferase
VPAPEVVVDVCVLTWNTREVSVDALRRLVASDQGVAYRILVRDNASSDGTAEAVAAAVPNAEVDAGADNLGFARGVNTLLARTTAPYVLVLNGDAWLEDRALARMVDAARAHPGAGAVAPRLLRPDGSLEHSTWPFPSLRLSLLYATGLRAAVPRGLAERWMLEPDWRHDRARWVSWAVGAALLLPRPALERVGGLDDSFFMYGEDVEWCWRMRDAGLRIWFEPAAVVRHIGGASGTRRYAGQVVVRKTVASTRLMRRRRGPFVAACWQLLEVVTALRIAALARLRRDDAAREWARAVVRAHLRPPTAGE